MTDGGVVARADGFLLDFDGPMCDLFPPGSGSAIADRTREPVRAAGVVMPSDVTRTVEHLVVLAFAAEHAPAVLEEVERAAIEGEIEAARSAPITPGVREFLEECARTGRPVVIVSSNAAAAIELFLELHELTHLIAGVLGRPFARPELMKPDRFLAGEALALLGERSRCWMIGDSATDFEFSRRAGLSSIAYAKSARHEAHLRPAGPDAIVHTMSELAAMLKS